MERSCMNLGLGTWGMDGVSKTLQVKQLKIFFRILLFLLTKEFYWLLWHVLFFTIQFSSLTPVGAPVTHILRICPGMKKFPVVMEAMTKIPGYYMNVFCPVDASIWLPQNRKRLILIGTKRPFNINPPTSTKRIRLKDIIEKDADVNVPDCVYSRLDGKYRDLPIISDPEDDNALAPTCVAHYGKDQGTRLVRDKRYPRGVRPYTLREWARLQGMPDDHKFAGGQTAVFKQIGNGVAFHKGLWIGKELMRYFN